MHMQQTVWKTGNLHTSDDHDDDDDGQLSLFITERERKVGIKYAWETQTICGGTQYYYNLYSVFCTGKYFFRNTLEEK